MLWFLFFVALFVLFVFLSRRNEKRRRERYNVPESANEFDYLGGHPTLHPGKVYAWRENDSVALVSHRDGQRTDISADKISGVELVSDVQSVNTGGGRSIGGALVGGAVAGPVGAIVGGHKKTKVKNVDHSTVKIHIQAQNGAIVDMIFKGGQPVYHKLAQVVQLKI